MRGRVGGAGLGRTCCAVSINPPLRTPALARSGPATKQPWRGGGRAATRPTLACNSTPRARLAGTTNFVHRYPFSCVSIGLTVAKQPVVGVVFNPILGELYHAGERCLVLLVYKTGGGRGV